MKPKLLIWSDFVAPTGFGNVAKNLFSDLHKHFDVSVVAINYYGDQRYDTSKWFVYSAGKDDLMNRKNLFRVAKAEQPEVIILFQDIFNISDIIDKLKEVSPKSKILSYFPIDAEDFSLAWVNALNKSDAIITYTDWAVNVVKRTIPDLNKPLHRLYHGVDTNTFKPHPITTITKMRKEVKWFGKFVIVNVNRFQPRKAVPLSVRAFSMFAKGYKICKCGNWYPIHKNYCDLNGCPDTDATIVNCAKEDVHYYLHMDAEAFSMGSGRTNTLQHHFIMSGFKDEDYGKLFSINSRRLADNNVPDSTINDIYNCANLNISTTLGEGCGLSLIESAAAGTKSLAPRNSAIPEMLKGEGVLVDNIAVYSHPHDNSFMRPIVDVRKFVEELEVLYEEWKAIGADKYISSECIDMVRKHYQWQDKRDQLLSIIKTVYDFRTD